MDEYTASNGYEVAVVNSGYFEVWNRSGELRYGFGLHTIQALREFFQAERDEELGRWRFPANPNYVVYPPEADDEGQALRILFEPGGRSSDVYTREWLASVVDPGSWTPAACAKAYFEAHPESKPWHDAKPGEVWVIDQANTVTTAARAGLVNERMKFEPVDNITRHIDVDDPIILDARRIWPEDAS